MKKNRRGKFLYHLSDVADVPADELGTVIWRIKDEVGDELIVYKDGRFGFRCNEDPTKRVAKCLKGSNYHSVKDIGDDLMVHPDSLAYALGASFRFGSDGVTWNLLRRAIYEVRGVRVQDKAKRMDPYTVDFMTRQNRKVALMLSGLLEELIVPSGKSVNDIKVSYRGTGAFKGEDIGKNVRHIGRRPGRVAFPSDLWEGWRHDGVRKAEFVVDLSYPVAFGTRGFNYGTGLCGIIGSKWLRAERKVLRVEAYSSTRGSYVTNILPLAVVHDNVIVMLTYIREDPAQTVVFGQGYSPSGWLGIGKLSDNYPYINSPYQHTFEFLSMEDWQCAKFISGLKEDSNEFI